MLVAQMPETLIQCQILLKVSAETIEVMHIVLVLSYKWMLPVWNSAVTY